MAHKGTPFPVASSDVATTSVPGAMSAADKTSLDAVAGVASIAQASVVGRASGAGTGAPTALTGVQVSAILSGANDTITTAGSNLTDLDTSSLDGDNDGDYECWDTLLATGGAVDYTLQPNNASTNQKCVGVFANPSVSGENRTDLLIGSNGGATSVVYAHYFLTSKSGRTRIFNNSIFTDQAAPEIETVTGIWSGAGNITSLRRHGSVASRIATGSFGRVRRRRNLT